MPIYEYRCQDCEQIFEEWQKDFKEQDVPCPVCGARAERLISSTSFILKGSGWYVTDYCKRGGDGAMSPAPSGGGAASGNASATTAQANGNGNGAKADATPPPAASPAASAPAKAQAGAAD